MADIEEKDELPPETWGSIGGKALSYRGMNLIEKLTDVIREYFENHQLDEYVVLAAFEWYGVGGFFGGRQITYYIGKPKPEEYLTQVGHDGKPRRRDLLDLQVTGSNSGTQWRTNSQEVALDLVAALNVGRRIRRLHHLEKYEQETQ